MSLRERILQFRAKYNLSQEDFANLCKLNVMTINSIETGKRKPTQLTETKIKMTMEEKENNA